ncbi:uncharacterized protein B0T15DRAFT_155602 [Chaetomium strumarium]|uniref:Uncharacterized protein n=1 Tax=Chaetomium strumarium TaxID=1170767 RepID=A0AAJ0GVJ7_9PEZI|nr:hypothetical protein B0T15DRAFT_155602 [Chaetomium strumarium]
MEGGQVDSAMQDATDGAAPSNAKEQVSPVLQQQAEGSAAPSPIALDPPQPAASPTTAVTTIIPTVKSGQIPETAARAGNLAPSQRPTIAETADQPGASSAVDQSQADNNEEPRREEPINTTQPKPQNQPESFTPITTGTCNLETNKTAAAESPNPLQPQPIQPAQQPLPPAPRPPPPPQPQQQQQQQQQQTAPQPHPHPPQHLQAPHLLDPPPPTHPHAVPGPQPQPQHSRPYPGPPHTQAPQSQQPAPHYQARAQIPPPSHQHQQPPLQPYHHHHSLPQPQQAAPASVTSPPPPHQTQVSTYHSHPQPQPVLRSQALHRTTLLKPAIMDPPAMRKQSQSQVAVMGFPSPTQDHANINPKFVDDCTRMNFAIQQSLPEAVRRIVRDHWEKCLLGSDFHQAFVVSLVPLFMNSITLLFLFVLSLPSS